MPEDITIVGNISRDTAWYGTHQQDPFFGGAGLNIAWAIAQCGFRPQLISILGQQDRSVLDELERSISTKYIQMRPGETCRFTLHYAENGQLRQIESSFGVALHFNAYLQHIDLEPHHYHVCCRHPIQPAAFLARLGARGISFSLDFMVSSIAAQVADCQQWIALADCIFLNRQEYAILSRIYDVSTIKMVLITNAQEPVQVLQYGKERYSQTCPLANVKEATGAGDVFIGTFLATYYLQNKPLAQSLKNAIGAAQKSLGSLGVCNFPVRGEKA